MSRPVWRQHLKPVYTLNNSTHSNSRDSRNAATSQPPVEENHDLIHSEKEPADKVETNNPDDETLTEQDIDNNLNMDETIEIVANNAIQKNKINVRKFVSTTEHLRDHDQPR